MVYTFIISHEHNALQWVGLEVSFVISQEQIAYQFY